LFDDTIEPEVALEAISRLATKKLKSLDEKIEELKKLQGERDHWQKLLDQAQSILGVAQPISAAPGTETEKTPSDILSAGANMLTDDFGKKSNREKTRALIVANGKPMKLDEIVAGFRNNGWKLSELNGGEVLRGMLWREKGTFTRVKAGFYDVIN